MLRTFFSIAITAIYISGSNKISVVPKIIIKDN